MRPTTAGGRGATVGASRLGRLLSVVVLVSLAAAGSAAPAAAAPGDAADTSFHVVLDESGDADVTLRLAFDVSTEADREALSRLRANRSEIVAAFGDGMAAVADRAASTTGRPMTVSDARMDVTTSGSRGTVDLTVTWRGLAAVEGDRLRVTAPFDDGFRPPGRFVLRPPEGYTVSSATPAPEERTGAEVVWGAESRLDGFEATVRPEERTTTSLPGFGVPTALAGFTLAAAIAVLSRRRRP